MVGHRWKEDAVMPRLTSALLAHKRRNIEFDTLAETCDRQQRQRLRRPTLFLPPTPTTAIMSDNGEIEVENPTGIAILPKEVTDEQGSVKLFNKAGSSRILLLCNNLTFRSGPTRRSKSATSH